MLRTGNDGHFARIVSVAVESCVFRRDLLGINSRDRRFMHARLPGRRYGFDFYDYYALQWKWREDSFVTKISLLCGLNKRPWQPCVAPIKALHAELLAHLVSLHQDPCLWPLGSPAWARRCTTAGPVGPSLLERPERSVFRTCTIWGGGKHTTKPLLIASGQCGPSLVSNA